MVTATPDQLKAFFTQWEQAHRDGLCISPEEVAAQPVEVIAQVNADRLYDFLSKQPS